MKKFAFFDFDKTITCEHSILSLIKYVFKTHPIQALFYGIKAFLGLLLSLLTKDYRFSKNSVLQCYYLLSPEEKDFFLHDLMPRKYYQDALKEIASLKAKGYTLYLVSASMEPYLIPLGEALGFDHVFGTQVEGKSIVGANHRQEEKVRRLKKFFEEEGIVFHKKDSVAYSDSYSADEPMLNLADHKFLINSSFRKEGFTNLTWS